MCEWVVDEHGNAKRIYPPGVILTIMRVALTVLSVAMLVVAWKVNRYAYLPEPWHRTPFVVMAGLAGFWGYRINSPRAAAWCSTLLCLGMIFRGFELGVHGPESVRVVAAVTWVLLGIWCFAMGVINQVTLSQKKAGELWGFLPPHRK